MTRISIVSFLVGGFVFFLLVTNPITSTLAAAAADTAKDESFRISRGDVLQVVVPGDEALSREYTVSATGHILVPLIGKVLAEGLTVDELTEGLSVRLKKYLLFPEVIVGVKEAKPRPLRAYVLGEVKTPGLFVLEKGKAHVLDAVALAGGLTARSVGESAQLYRAGENPVPLDLKGLLRDGRISNNVPLVDGDLIVVPTRDLADIQVTSFGEVNKPGVFEWRDGMKLLDLVAMAGGFTPRADQQNVLLNRQRIDLRPLLQGGDVSLNVAVKPGDTLFVPLRRDRVLIFGEVKNPGAIEYRDEMRLLDALMGAGGVLQDPAAVTAGTENKKQAQVIREDAAPVNLDLDALLTRGKTSENVPLKPNDVIMVSASREGQASIFGSIAKPGFYPLRQGDTLLDLVTRAGFPTADAAADKTTILRIQPGKKPLVLHVDLMKAITAGDQTQNAVIQKGDIITIPNKVVRKGMSFIDVLGVLTPIAFFYDIVSRSNR